VSIAGHVYVVGGYAGTTPALPDVLVRTSGRRWKVICQLPVPVRYAAVAVAQGAIWVIGGERNAAMVDAIQRIDLNTGRVRVVGHLSSPLGHAAAATFGSRILIIGGRTGPDTMSSTLWWFDPGSHELRRAGALPTPLADSAVVTRRHFAYLVGGETPQLSDRVLRVTVR
jgi:N-acetylneuraminic acid mutarotase